MKPTIYSTRRTGLLSDTDLVRPRPHSRRMRPILPSEPVIRIDVGDAVDAVDSGWRSWARDPSRAA